MEPPGLNEEAGSSNPRRLNISSKAVLDFARRLG
jgi:hypothetical protein